MNVSPITSQINSTNFKSKLPPINYKYTNGYKDYWNEFAEQCFREGTGSRLKNALDKLKANSDENLLVLTHSKNANADEYTFSLHPESKTKDIYIERSINPKNIVVKQADNKIEVNSDVGFIESDSLVTVILRTLENIVDSIMPANKAIFGNQQNAVTKFINQYRG